MDEMEKMGQRIFDMYVKLREKEHELGWNLRKYKILRKTYNSDKARINKTLGLESLAADIAKRKNEIKETEKELKIYEDKK